MENSRHESIELQTVQNLIPTFFIIYLDYVYTIGIFDIETFQHCTIIDLFMMHDSQLQSYLNQFLKSVCSKNSWRNLRQWHGVDNIYYFLILVCSDSYFLLSSFLIVYIWCDVSLSSTTSVISLLIRTLGHSLISKRKTLGPTFSFRYPLPVNMQVMDWIEY